MKKYIIVLIMFLLISISFSIYTYASSSITDTGAIISAMSDAKPSNMARGDGSSIPQIINTIIGLLQVAGTGISIVVVTILGIKYLMASPSEKADTKKSILPIIIGCVLLFGAVNLMSALLDFTEKSFE